MADLSGTIASGGTAQTAAAADVNRQTLSVQNTSDTDMWIAFGATAVADSPSYIIPAGESMDFGHDRRELITKAISVFGATTGKKFTMFDTKG